MMLRKGLVLFALLLPATATTLAPRTAAAQMSEGERKAAARASYLEGVELQEKGRPAEALAKFEGAQKLFDAPTHVLRIAQCQAATGKLVEAAESYESLTRKPLPPGSPEAFVQAQEQAKAESAALKTRIPTLKISLQPEPGKLQNLQININDKQMPNELLGLARPVNPGTYRVLVSATGYGMAQPFLVEVAEKESKATEIVLQAGVTTPATPPPADGAAPPAPPPPYEAKPASDDGSPSSGGLLLGVRPLLVVPTGDVRRTVKFSDYAGAGPGLGLDVIGRFAKMFLLGGSFELASLGAPDRRTFPTGTTAEVGTRSYFVGAAFGIIPNVDRFTFVANAGVGYRVLDRSLTLRSNATNATSDLSESFGGFEFTLDAGVSIPAGPLRVVPKAGLAHGVFGSRSCDSPAASAASLTSLTGCGANTIDSSTHTMLSLAVGVYWHIDFKRANASGARSDVRHTALR